MYSLLVSFSFSFNQTDSVNTHSIESELQPVEEAIIYSKDDEVDVKEYPKPIANSIEISPVVAGRPPHDGILLKIESPAVLDE
jgi:hypothetical protein